MLNALSSKRLTVPNAAMFRAALAIVLVFSILPCDVEAVEPLIILEIDSFEVHLNDTLVEVPVYLCNPEDSVTGFDIDMVVDNPGLVAFVAECPIIFDGEIISQFEVLTWNFLGSGTNYLKAFGMYNWPEPPENPDPILPSEELRHLFTLRLLHTDSLGMQGCDVSGSVMISKYQTQFSDPCTPISNLIGYVDVWYYDTTFENCVEWIEDSCVAWQDTIVDSTSYLEPDFDLLDYRDGSYTVECPPCGDANGSYAVDIDDVVFLIAYIFSAGPAPDPLEAGDADCSSTVDIDDVVYLIAFIFSGGPEPCADCP